MSMLLERGTRLKRSCIGVFALLSLLILFSYAPKEVRAQSGQSSDDWQFAAEIYVWGASVGGETSTGSDIDVDFDDLLSDLDLGFMGAVGAKKDKWGIIADVIYLDVSDGTTLDSGVRVNGELTGWIFHPIVTYNLVDSDRLDLNVLAGARYLYLEPGVEEVGVTRVSESSSYWDGIAGFRGRVLLSDKWYLPYHLDIGAGNSDFTWQALGGIGYRFKWFDLSLAYRYLSWDFDDDEATKDLNLHGPFAGFIFHF